MNNIIQNITSNERVVEISFMIEMLDKFCFANACILDVGGIPSINGSNDSIISLIKNKNAKYKVCDFRGGDFTGDFISYEFKDTFDIIMFLSSLEHFSYCTEGDRLYRAGEDRRGFIKALSILKKEGIILLTVPFGKHYFTEKSHQNYNMDGILTLSKGSELLESYTYKLQDNLWIQANPDNMADVLYTNIANGVGCFTFKK